MNEPPEVPTAEMVSGGYWQDGKWHAPEGWPEGAGWVVCNADGSIDQWGPAEDLALIASTLAGQPSGDLSAALKGVPTPAEPPE